MSKKNEELARQIIEQHGNVTQVPDHSAIMEPNKKGELEDSGKKIWSANIVILGMGFNGVAKTEREAVDDMVNQLAGELDSGVLQLSDTWAEDNLGGVK